MVSISQGFVLDATAHHDVELPLPADSVRAIVRQISTLQTFMPGVVDIADQGEGWFLYRTERDIPFSEPMRADFRVVRVEGQDGSVTWRTPGTEAANWMSYRLEAVAKGSAITRLLLRMRVRLVRSEGTQIHLLAPLLGEDYLSKRMEDDLHAMLKIFADRLSRHCTLARTARN